MMTGTFSHLGHELRITVYDYGFGNWKLEIGNWEWLSLGSSGRFTVA
jgi:hypothetical protein